MSLESNLNWLKSHLPAHELHGAKILDVGSRNCDKTLRPWLEQSGASVTGVDIVEGIEVDVICDASRLTNRFEPASFDICLCVEALEHIENWKAAVISMKMLVKPGGPVLITTRTPGYAYHGYPDDYWRFTSNLLRQAFSDFIVDAADDDWLHYGCYLRARKPSAVDYNRLHAMEVERNGSFA
jgi:SAM-dependent methyltransferase